MQDKQEQDNIMVLSKNLFCQVLDLDLQKQFTDAITIDDCHKDLDNYVERNLKV